MNNKAFTLIELLIVLAIMGMIVGLGIPQAKRIFRVNLKTSATQIAGLIRFAYDSAVIKSKIHRIAFDIEKGVYRLEISTTDQLVFLEGGRGGREEVGDKKEKKSFSPFPGSMGKENKLPSGIVFENVEKIKSKRKFSEGVAYLYFFPQGVTEDVVIRLNGKKSKTGFYSIRVNPLSARTRIEGRYLEV